MSRSPFVRHTKRAFPENGTMTAAHLSTASPRSSGACLRNFGVLSHGRIFARLTNRRSEWGERREGRFSKLSSSHPRTFPRSPPHVSRHELPSRASLASSNDSHARIALFFPSALSLRRVLTLSFIIILAYWRGPDPLSSIRSISLLSHERRIVRYHSNIHARGFHD